MSPVVLLCYEMFYTFHMRASTTVLDASAANASRADATVLYKIPLYLVRLPSLPDIPVVRVDLTYRSPMLYQSIFYHMEQGMNVKLTSKLS